MGYTRSVNSRVCSSFFYKSKIILTVRGKRARKRSSFLVRVSTDRRLRMRGRSRLRLGRLGLWFTSGRNKYTRCRRMGRLTWRSSARWSLVNWDSRGKWWFYGRNGWWGNWTRGGINWGFRGRFSSRGLSLGSSKNTSWQTESESTFWMPNIETNLQALLWGHVQLDSLMVSKMSSWAPWE